MSEPTEGDSSNTHVLARLAKFALVIPMDSAPRPLTSAFHSRFLLLCFFVSGATSLALETVWSKELSYLLGNDLYGTATTVVAYMAGLGAGSWLATRLYHRVFSPLRTYAALQALIGILGMVSLPLLRSLHPTMNYLHGLAENTGPFLLARFLVTFLALLPATMLMGMTLPIVLGAYDGRREKVGATAGILYGANTMGALVGTLFAGLYLIPNWGLSTTCTWVAQVDVVLGLVVLISGLLFKERVEKRPANQTTLHKTKPPLKIRITHRQGFDVRLTYAVFGAVGLGLELCWFRLLSPIIGPTAHAFAITLAVFLMGIALGSVVTSRLVGRLAPRLPYAMMLAVTGTLAALPLFYLERLPSWYQEMWASSDGAGTPSDLLLVQSFQACALMLPATLTMGGAYPFAVATLSEQVEEKVPASVVAADLFYWNTFGGVVGTIVWGFFAIPQLGVHRAVQLSAAISLGLCLALFLGKTRKVSARQSAFVVPAAIAGSILVLLAPAADPSIMHVGVHATIRSKRTEKNIAHYVSKTAEVVFTKDGLNGTVAVVKNRYGADEFDLVFAGKWVATTHRASRGHLHFLGHLPMLLAPAEPKSALVVGMGAGISTGALLTYPQLERVDLVELEPVVVEAAHYFKKFNHDPLSDPRLHLTLEDGRTFLSFSKRKFDLITSDPIHPWVKGAANLYTVEYYKAAAKRLTDRGIFSQWIPSSMSKESADSIVRSAANVFPHVQTYISHYEVIMLAAFQPIQPTQDVFETRGSFPAVLADLTSVRSNPTRLFRHVSRAMKPIVKGSGQLNTDDNVYLEHQLPWDYFFEKNFLLRPKKTTRKPNERRGT